MIVELDKIRTRLTNLKDDIENKVIKQETKERLIYELATTFKGHALAIFDLLEEIECENKLDEIKKVIGDDIYICTRSWDAWQAGTMTADDFKLATEDDEFMAQIEDVLNN